jgi:hypothetical protein
MGTIKDIGALDPGFQSYANAFIAELHRNGVIFRIDETLRTPEVQEAYWLQSRAPLAEVNAARSRAGLSLLRESENKTTVTWTRDSVHFTGKAIDIVPLIRDEQRGWVVPWDYVKYAKIWLEMGKIGRSVGLEWGGEWPPFNSAGVGKDPPHYQKV